MDRNILFVIIALIVVIVLFDYYKRQKNKVTHHLHADNLKLLLTISALESNISILSEGDENYRRLITSQITQLINGYEKGEVSAAIFKKQMNALLKKEDELSRGDNEKTPQPFSWI